MFTTFVIFDFIVYLFSKYSSASIGTASLARKTTAKNIVPGCKCYWLHVRYQQPEGVSPVVCSSLSSSRIHLTGESYSVYQEVVETLICKDLSS